MADALFFSCLLLFLAAMQCTGAVDYAVNGNTSNSDGCVQKNVLKVTLFIENGDGVAFANNNQIHVNANYLGTYKGDLRREFNGVLYHKMTHIWQRDGNGQTSVRLIEGIADFVRLKANYIPSHWVQPGHGDRWDQRSDVTARFLEYYDGLRNGFVAELNKKMRSGYNAGYFVELDYKAKYGN
ncbi:hypothetical protein ERO13_D13G042366v2 [Gossypium hirsutum]|nr:hypothetical protein ERO13_D13G042366v2 [Gossypium hirsutum]